LANGRHQGLPPLHPIMDIVVPKTLAKCDRHPLKK